MTIISVGCEQAEVGTTTAVTNLAAIQAGCGWRVAIVDMSDNGAAINWAAARKNEYPLDNRLIKNSTEIEAVRAERHDKKVIGDLYPRFDKIFVDAGAAEAAEFREVMSVTDEFLIPVFEARYVEESLGRLNRVVGEAKADNPGLKAGIFFNFASLQIHCRNYQVIVDRLNGLRHLGFYGMVQQNEVFRRVGAQGRGVHEIALGQAYTHFPLRDMVGLGVGVLSASPL